MKQKLILLLLCCLCSLGAVAQGVVTRQKPRQTTTQPTTPSKPRQNTQQRQKPRQQTQARPQNSGTASGRAISAPVTRSGDNMVLSVGGVSYTMVYVQGGTFTMGATSEQGSDAESVENPTHSVTLSSYYMGETEVTQDLWQAVMGSNPSYFKGSNLPVEQVNVKATTEEHLGFTGRGEGISSQAVCLLSEMRDASFSAFDSERPPLRCAGCSGCRNI